jgi:hypothetical protein
MQIPGRRRQRYQRPMRHSDGRLVACIDTRTEAALARRAALA